MITFRPIASSSAANSYLVSDGETDVLVDAGVKIQELRRSLNFRLSSLSGVLISHRHGDHTRSVKDLVKCGVDIYGLRSTLSDIGLIEHHRSIPIESEQQFQLGTWTILPFKTEHDVESVGFLMANQLGEKLFLATDTFYIRYRFSGLTHIAIECNFSQKILDENIAAGRVPHVMRRRLMKSHFSLEHVKDFLRANDLHSVREIWLLHLSDTNSSEEMFKREIQELSGKTVYVAGR